MLKVYNKIVCFVQDVYYNLVRKDVSVQFS